MKKLNLILLFSLIYTFSFAQNSLLYEISKPGQQKSYLFGTMHVKNEDAFNFNDSVFWAIDQCKHAAFELDLREKEMMNMASNIKNIIDSNFINQAKLYLKNDFLPKLMKEMPASTLANKITNEFIPMYSELIKSTKPQNSRDQFVDQLLQFYANKNDKNIVSIETFDEQINVFLGDVKTINFDSMKLSEKIIKFLKTEKLDYDLSRIYGNSDEMVKMYQQHNLSQLCDYIQQEKSNDKIVSKKFYDNIFYKRNQIMFDRTKDLVKNESAFIAVGAGHLCGENGLINQFKNAGYTVRPMNDMKKNKNELQWQTITNNEYSIDIPKNATLDTAEFDYLSMYSNNDYKSSLISNRGIATFKIEKEIIYQDTEAATPASESLEYDFSNYFKYDSSYNYELDSTLSPEPTNDYSELSEDTEYIDPIDKYMDSILRIDSINAAKHDKIDHENNEEKVFNDEEKIETDPKKNKLSEFFTPEQTIYLKEVGDSVKGAFMKAVFLNSDIASIYNNKDSTITIKNKKGATMDLVYKNEFFQKSVTYTEVKGDYLYKIIITGDKNFILSEDLRRYFLSFKFKN